MTNKEAVEWLKTFRKAKFKCVVPAQVIEALELLQSRNRCLECGRKLKKIGPYGYTCNCFPKGLIMSKG